MKKILSVVIILIVIMLGTYIFNLQNDNEKENTNMSNEIEKNNERNEQSNSVITNELTNEIVNNIVTNEIENTTSSETLEESPKTSEQKAIDIAKKDWGNDRGVNFSVEGMDGNGNYIVAVRDSNTVALAFYSVNVSNETFTKREMN